MRILCLHGAGTNGAIFESQTVGFRSLLPKDWEWHFIDGDEDADPAPGVASIFPGPYLSHYTEPSLRNVQEVFDTIDDIVDEEGPFDAIMGFSQGGAIATSYILRHQLQRPFESPAFRFGIFLCSAVPFSWDAQHGYKVASATLNDQDTVSDLQDFQRGGFEEPCPSEKSAMELPPHTRNRVQRILQDTFGDKTELDNFRILLYDTTKEQLQIPTVHVYGLSDPSQEQSLAVRDLCNEKLLQSIQHNGGHEIPKAPSQQIARAIQKVAIRAEFLT